MQPIAGRVPPSVVKTVNHGTIGLHVYPPFLLILFTACRLIIHVHDLVTLLQLVQKMSRAKHWYRYHVLVGVSSSLCDAGFPSRVLQALPHLTRSSVTVNVKLPSETRALQKR